MSSCERSSSSSFRLASSTKHKAHFVFPGLFSQSQTPTLNASPIVRGIVEACSTGGPQRTGIEVTLFLGLGFNDKGESIPFQGGTNEQVVFRLYGHLRKLRKEQNLHVYWYTGQSPCGLLHSSTEEQENSTHVHTSHRQRSDSAFECVSQTTSKCLRRSHLSTDISLSAASTSRAIAT